MFSSVGFARLFIVKWMKNNKQEEDVAMVAKPQATKKFILFLFTKSNLFYLPHFLRD